MADSASAWGAADATLDAPASGYTASGWGTANASLEGTSPAGSGPSGWGAANADLAGEVASGFICRVWDPIGLVWRSAIFRHSINGSPWTTPSAVKPGIGIDIVPDPTNSAQFTADLNAVVAAGANWIRVGLPSWFAGGIFGTSYFPNTANMAFYLSALQACKTAGLKVALTMAQAQENDAWSEAQFTTYNRLMWRDVAQKLGAYVDVVQIFNEHDTRSYRNQSVLSSLTPTYLTNMAAVLVAAREEWNAYAPTVKTFTTVMGYPVNDTTQTRWQMFYDTIAAAVDYLGFNVYPETGPSTIASVTTRLNAMQSRYGGKRAIVAEVGLPVTTGGYTSTDAATAIPAQLQAAAAANPVTVLLYQLRNLGTTGTDGEQMFGILDNAGVQRAHYSAVVAAINALR